MKKSIKAISLITAVIVVSSSAFVHASRGHCDHEPNRNQHDMHMQVMAKVLELSEIQKNEINVLHEEMQDQRAVHRAEMLDEENSLKINSVRALDPGTADYSDQVAALAEKKAEFAKQRVVRRAEHQTKIYAILDDAQREEWRSFQAELGEKRMKNHRQN